jgi:hypothetical protein
MLLLGWTNQGVLDGQGMWHVSGRSVLWGLVGKRGGKGHLVDLGVDGKIILKRTLK